MRGPGAPELPETRKLWQLEDQEILKVLRNRGTELEIAFAFSRFINMLQITAESNSDAQQGIFISIGLAKLFSQTFAPGNPKHPFIGFDLSVAEIIRASVPQAREPRKINQDALLEPKPLTRVEIEDPRERKARLRATRLVEGSKLSRINEHVLSFSKFRVFNTKELLKEVQVKIPEATPQDIANSMYRLKKLGLISKIDSGLYKLKEQS